jgi:hypothetical protein
MRWILIPAAITMVLLCTSCSKKEAAPAGERPRASVVLRDGTKISGTVLESTATEMKILGDNNVTQTIPTSQIQSVNYGDAAAPPANAPATQAAAPAPARQSAPPPERASAPAKTEPPPPAPSPVTTKTYELAVGTEVPVRTNEPIDSGKASEGQAFAGEVTKDIRDAAGDVVIPRGSQAQIIIKSASKGGRFRGASDLVLDLNSVNIEGRPHRIETADIGQKGRSGIGANKRTAEFTGGGAALGAIVGAIAGGGRGAAIGAGSGAGAGALTQILTKGGAIRVPVETVLTFKLDRPLRFTETQ